MAGTQREPTINPFATRYVAPGKLEWIPPRSPDAYAHSGKPASAAPLSADEHLDILAERFHRACGGRAAIVGPHGSGKSTLLEHLVPRLAQGAIHRIGEDLPQRSNHTPQTLWFVARSSGKRPAVAEYAQGDFVVVDGFEQFGLLSRFRIIFGTRMKGAQLLVTSHRRSILPMLWTTKVDAATLKEICTAAAGLAARTNPTTAEPNRLLPESVYRETELESMLRRFQGNARECLMHLYDLNQSPKGNTEIASARDSQN